MSLNFKTYSIFSSTYPILTREEIESVFNQVDIVFDTIQELQAPDTGPVFDSETETETETTGEIEWGLDRGTLDMLVESMDILDTIREGFVWSEQWRGNQELFDSAVGFGIDEIDKIVDIFLDRLTTNPDFLIEDVLQNSGILWEGRDISEEFGKLIEEFYGVMPNIYILSEQFSFDLMNSIVETLGTEQLNIFDNLSVEAQQNYINEMGNYLSGLYLGQYASQIPNVMNDITNNISSFIVNSYNSSNLGVNSRYSNLLSDINSYAANINASNALIDVDLFSNLGNVDTNINGIFNNLSQVANANDFIGLGNNINNNANNIIQQVAGVNNLDLNTTNNLSNINNLFNNIQLNSFINSATNFNIATQNNIVRLNSISNIARTIRVNSYTSNNNVNRFRP